MKKFVMGIVVLWVCAAARPAAAQPVIRDIFPDTWVASDALGRTMPDYAAVGPVKRDQRRVVGIFYVTWHEDSAHTRPAPYAADVAKILARDPKARLDARHPLWNAGTYHWGEPEMGYFLSKDEWVIRRDMSMLADAGVDVLVMDVTNAVRYWDEWDVIFRVMRQMRAAGNQVPQFCFWAFNGPAITVVQDLYDKIYKTEKYKDLWFLWDGKPLLLYNGTPFHDSTGQTIQHPNPHYEAAAKTDPKHPHYGDPDYCEPHYKDYTKEVKNFFTLRTMWWGYYKWAGQRFIGTEDNWSFGYELNNEMIRKMNPTNLVSTHRGQREQAAVTPAQHPSSLVGKSWTREQGEPELNDQDLPVPTHVPWLGQTVAHPEGYGIYFQQRWDEALAANPQFLYINDWNEWTAGKYPPAAGTKFDFMRRQSDYFFVDQYNPEFNRCVQPMRGGYTDNYYMQMAQNIRRYKGVRPLPENRGLHPVTADGRFDDWAGVQVEYRDTIGDTTHRAYKGYGGLHYTNTSGRNDLTTAKVAVSQNAVHFYAETAAPLTPHTDTNWMLLLIDADKNPATGWCGYDFLINKHITDAKTTTLMRWTPAGAWADVAKLEYGYAGKALEVTVPRTLLGLTGDAFTFGFKWADHPQELKDAISLCTDGDTAPNRRFNYRCVWHR